MFLSIKNSVLSLNIGDANWLDLPSLSETSCGWLERVFSKDEILETLNDMDGKFSGLITDSKVGVDTKSVHDIFHIFTDGTIVFCIT